MSSWRGAELIEHRDNFTFAYILCDEPNVGSERWSLELRDYGYGNVLDSSGVGKNEYGAMAEW
jgi:hypothetical protein